jgi:hypothetical protein
VEQLAVVARLKDGALERAKALVSTGAPFDPAAERLTRHTVFLSSHEVIFVFEAHEVEWIVDDIVSDPFRSSVSDAFAAWRPLIDGSPRIARVAFAWERDEARA